MDRYQLKNIMIIILALVNLFLLGSLAMRETSEQAARRRSEEQLVELFAADEITLNADAISSKAPSMPVSMTRDTVREREAAEFFLGESLHRDDQGGGIYSYTGDSGVALFREDGSFDVAGSLAEENAEEICRKFCRSFSYGEPIFVLDESGSGTAVAVYQHDKQPVYNCMVTFHFDRGMLQTLSGTLLPESGTETIPDRELLSSLAALTAFQKMRRETGAVVSVVTEMYPCYRLQSSTAMPMSLTPAWCIVTDTSKYYVNCITEAVTTG